MLRTNPILAVMLCLAVALAGCAGGGDNDPTPSTNATPSGTTPTPGATPASTPVVTVTPPVSVPGVTPAVTPPVSPPVNPPPGGNATPARVFVVSAPEKAGNGTSPEVCWRVEGTGISPHTAIHYDDVSHPNGTFTAYPDAAYPDNGPATTTGSFALPATFCAEIRDINATVYYRAHALVGGASVLGDEETLVAGSGNQTIDTVGAPEVFGAGLQYNLCWELPGVTATSVHTAIHSDTVSHLEATSFQAYPNATYPNNGPATTTGSFQMPGPFCANVTMPMSGALYLRAHAIVDGAHYLGPERSIVVGSRLAIANGLPLTAAAGSTVEVCWRAEGGGVSPHTAIHWDTASHPDATSFQVYPNAVYPDNGPATTTGNFTLPGPFCADLTMPASGSVYFRPHAIYSPGGSELGEEYQIRVA